jgi:hypothetical protein
VQSAKCRQIRLNASDLFYHEIWTLPKSWTVKGVLCPVYKKEELKIVDKLKTYTQNLFEVGSLAGEVKVENK